MARDWLSGVAASIEARDLERALGGLCGPGGEGSGFGTTDAPRLRNLRSRVVEEGLRSADTAGRMLATLLGLLNGAARPAGGAGGAGAAGTPASPASPAPTLAAVVTALVDEGSGPEAELLGRAAELEAAARRSAQRAAAPRRAGWAAPVGRPAELLFADLFDVAESAADRRRAALTALARPLAGLAESLLARTAGLPAGMEVPMVWQRSYSIGYGVPLSELVAAVHAEIDLEVAAESAGAGRRQAAASHQRGVERKEAAARRLGDAVSVLTAYRRQGEAIHAAAKAAYDAVLSLLGSHAESSA